LFSSGCYSTEEQSFVAEQRQAFVYKPYSRDQLLRAVRAVLEGARGDP
jgi:hypothetical protein